MKTITKPKDAGSWDFMPPIYRVHLVRENTGQLESAPNVDAAGAVLCRYLEGADREHFVVLMLDSKQQIIGINTVSVGGISEAIVEPRAVFKPAILANAVAVIVGHNHPSGDLTPSPDDLATTRRLIAAGKLLAITVQDHIITGYGGRFRSMAREGLLKEMI